MVQIEGKYQLIDSVNFAEVLAEMGVPEDFAKKVGDTKNILDITVDGKKISATSTSPTFNHTTEYVLDGEVESTLPDKTVIKSFAKQNGNVVTIENKTADGKHGGKRVYTFTDTGLLVTITSGKPGGKESKRTYKRI